jgi:hypothetical protein
MMERERKDRERQEAFEATWRSYKTAMESAFALQERTLEFARGILEAPAEALRTQTESNRTTLDTLTEQSKRQREALENLIRASTHAYANLLQAPFSYYQEVVEAMTAPWTSTEDDLESRAEESALPLEDYDSLTVREVSDQLNELSVEEIRQLRDHEAENKNRQTLMRRFDARIEGGS